MDPRGNSRFEYEGDVVIGRDVPINQQHPQFGQKTNFAYSMRLSVIAGVPSFFIIRIFRGGAGHCRESKSLLGVSGPVSRIRSLNLSDLTLVSRDDSIL